MRFRHTRTWVLSLVLWTLSANANDEWNCEASLSGHHFDFSTLGGERVLSRERDTPPTKMLDKLTLDLCKPLAESSEGAEGDRVR